MRVDFSSGHGRRPAQFRIAASNAVGRFRTPHARGVWKVSREGDFRRSQERQNSPQASIEGCILAMASFFYTYVFYFDVFAVRLISSMNVAVCQGQLPGPGPLRCGKSPDHWRRETGMRSKLSMDCRIAL
jgi:hypothetical protein